MRKSPNQCPQKYYERITNYRELRFKSPIFPCFKCLKAMKCKEKESEQEIAVIEDITAN